MPRVLASLVIVNPWTIACLAVGAALLAVLGWWLGNRRKRRHGLVKVTAYGLAAVLAVGSIADTVNVHFDYFPRADALIGQPTWPTAKLAALTTGTGTDAITDAEQTGAVVRLPVAPTVSGYGNYDALVYLPPQYFTDPTARFPVLYLLHGSPGVPLDWLRGGRAAQAAKHEALAGHPLIVVMPKASHHWLDDSECVNGREGADETYLTVDVVRAVDGALRTLPDRGARAIGGMSAGGYCALNLGLRHRSEFAAVLDMSGETHPSHAGGLSALFGHGTQADEQIIANSPDRYVHWLAPGPPLQVWMNVGTADKAIIGQMRTITPLLREHGVPTQFSLLPGGHTFHVWQPALRDGLGWLGGALAPATHASLTASSAARAEAEGGLS